MSARIPFLLALCAVCLGVLPPTVRAADLDLPSYVGRLRTARDSLAETQSLAGTERDAAILRAMNALAGIDGVVVDGKRYPAPHADALAALRQRPPEIGRAAAQLAMLEDLLAGEQTNAPDPRARQRLDTVLGDRAFHEAEPNLVQRQAIRVRSWISEQVRRLFRPLTRVRTPDAAQETPGAGPLARFIALLGSPALLGLIALLLGAAIAVLALRRVRTRRKRAADTAPAPPRTAAEWRQHADLLAARGEYRAAVRALFLGMLTDLDERRLIAFDPVLTDREYLREAQRQQGWLVEPLRPFVRLIEAIVYADAPCRATEYERARAFTDDVGRRITTPPGMAA